MKVYVVIKEEGDWEPDISFHGVFSTTELAQASIPKRKKRQVYYEVIETTLDKIHEYL